MDKCPECGGGVYADGIGPTMTLTRCMQCSWEHVTHD